MGRTNTALLWIWGDLKCHFKTGQLQSSGGRSLWGSETSKIVSSCCHSAYM